MRNSLSLIMFKAKFHSILLTESHLRESELTGCGSIYHHIAMTCRKTADSFRISIAIGNAAELRIVIYLKIHLCSLDRVAFCVKDLYLEGSRLRCIIADNINFGEVRSFTHDLLRTVISAEDIGMHEHSATCRSIEPTQIKNRLRLTCTEETPLTIHPSFYPGMVAVCMGPSRSIYLTCRNSNCSKGRYEQSRFLTTTAISCLYCCQRRTCTSVRRHIDSLFMAPVIDFKHSVLHGHILYSRSKLCIEYVTCRIQILIIDTHRKHKMPHFTLWDILSPWHFFQCLLCHMILIQIEGRLHIDNIAKRHICIHEYHRFLLIKR